MDNLRSHVKTVHHGKAGMQRLVITRGNTEMDADDCAGASTSESEINIVTVTTEDIVTLAASAVAQLTGQWCVRGAEHLTCAARSRATFLPMKIVRMKVRCDRVFAVVPVDASGSADETEALKAEITKAVEKVQEAGKTAKKERWTNGRDDLKETKKGSAAVIRYVIIGQ